MKLIYFNCSDVVGCQKSGSGRVRVSPSRVRVGFGCCYPGSLRVSGFFGFQKMNKICLKFVLSNGILFFKDILYKKCTNLTVFQAGNIEK